jgi:hypothetical protein
MPSFTDSFEMAVAQLSGDASVLGAAAWAQQIFAEQDQAPPQRKAKGKG